MVCEYEGGRHPNNKVASGLEVRHKYRANGNCVA
jgi:hypothetical protein